MIIGVPKEIKTAEYRVSITPSGVQELKRHGHSLYVESGAGEGSGFSDSEYLSAGARISDKKTLFKDSELIVKVKEPLPSEFRFIREKQALFTFLHLAPNKELTMLLLDKKVASFGYETLQKGDSLPLLAPMSEIAGRMAPLMGAYYLQKIYGGSGILPAGVPGVKPAKALILGAGVVGTNAARIARGLGFDTVAMDKREDRLQHLDEIFLGAVQTLPLDHSSVQEEIRSADIIIGAVLMPGGRTPHLITRGMLKTLKKGSVIVDVSVDQGGCVESTVPTTHEKPVYIVDDIIHYAVANMPGAYPHTSTLALTNATLPYLVALANKGIETATQQDMELRSALNTFDGDIMNEALKESLNEI
ncbi:MAG: alanine dehydrogenase [Nitrospirae bacterium]|nr:alanine dehydrogenase [Nitrospirota bacterium]